jgi:hypothetical protein
MLNASLKEPIDSGARLIAHLSLAEAPIFPTANTILIYAVKCDPSDPDDPVSEIFPLFQLVMLALPGITGVFAGVFDDPGESSVIPRDGPLGALAPIVSRLSMAWGASVKNAVTGRRAPTLETKHISVDRC